MKKILAIAWKDTILRFSSAMEWLFFLILPIVFTVVLAGGTGATTDSRIRLVTVDQAKSPLSAQLIAALGQSASVRPELFTLEKAEELMDNRQASSALLIPAEFNVEHLQEGTLQLELRQQPNNLNAMVAAQTVQATLGRISGAVDIARSSVAEAERIRPFASVAERQSYLQAALDAAQSELAQAPQRLHVEQATTRDPVEYDPASNSSAGQLITWTFIPLLGIAGSFAYERQKGTLRRLLVSPTPRATYLLGTLTGFVVLALLQMGILAVFGIVVMKLNWGRDPLGLAVMLVSSVLAAAALGTAMGAIVKTESQASGLAIMLGQVMALLGGCWYPAELFPRVVQTLGRIFPTTWAMQGLLDLVLRGKGWMDVLPEAGVLLGFALVFFAVGVWRFKYE